MLCPNSWAKTNLTNEFGRVWPKFNNVVNAVLREKCDDPLHTPDDAGTLITHIADVWSKMWYYSL